MRTRFPGLALLVGLAIIASACTSASSPSASAAPSAANPCAGATAHSGGTHVFPTDKTKWKIGVTTDVGTVNDKNFNEYTFNGAKQAAAALGAAVPPVVVPKDASELAKNIQGFVNQNFDIIVTAGFNNGQATTCAAHANPDIWFIGVDQGPPCVTPDGQPDGAFKCAGDAKTLLPKYVAISFQEDQAGYLAGMAAATMSKSGTLGAIGGITLCGPCVRYIQGFQLGAQKVNPNSVLKVAWVTTSDFTKAFNDPTTGKNFGAQFITQNKPDVLFQVAGKTGNGILDAACDASILGIGVDVDQALSYPNAAKCTLTSAEKKLLLATSTDIANIVAGTQKGGDDHWDAKRDGIGYSPFHDLESKIPSGLKAQLDAAFAAMKAGTLKTCPDKCGDISTLPK
ncbi:MAG: BMP family ABC transporter substrate-binding protein [Chloroflexi bacterium]|nr:MAG: BMP family ABC transporter substrate-binding protein [Chloroflexota bacterium]